MALKIGGRRKKWKGKSQKAEAGSADGCPVRAATYD
jgi:hypothetical protein